jgi:hypothetical protein
MTFISALFLSLLSFLFGLAASAYGSYAGKAIEARKELLEKMRDWIDANISYITAANEKYTLPASLWSDNAIFDLKQKSQTSVQRWLGVAQSIGSPKMYNAIREFVGSSIVFETRLLSMSKGNRLPNETKILSESYDEFVSKAQELHAIITEEGARGFPKWLTPNRVWENFIRRFK